VIRITRGGSATIVEERIGELIAAAQRAGNTEDPWDALVELLETTAALQARDRGFFQATEQYLLGHPDLRAATGRSSRRSIRWSSTRRRLASRARRRHHARPPGPRVGLGRVPAAVARPARGRLAPLLSIMLDALRPEAATPLPVPPFTYEEMEAAPLGDA
jgi:hypothetical protein